MNVQTDQFEQGWPCRITLQKRSCHKHIKLEKPSLFRGKN